MKPRCCPHLERLETLRLLSDLSLTLATDAPAYQIGQPIKFTLMETNTSLHDVNILEGPSLNGFVVTQNGSEVWRSNAGIQPMFVTETSLAPGRSLTFTATWDGHSNASNADGSASPNAPTGRFQVTNQATDQGSTAAPVSFTIGNSLPLNLPSNPTPPAPAISLPTTPSPTSTLPPPLLLPPRTPAPAWGPFGNASGVGHVVHAIARHPRDAMVPVHHAAQFRVEHPRGVYPRADHARHLADHPIPWHVVIHRPWHVR